MPYCIKCGAELSAGEKKCPLCKTEVYNPAIKFDETQRLYPAYNGETEEKVSPRGLLLLLSVVTCISFVVSLLSDIDLNGTVSWSAYVMGGLGLIYVIFVLPIWFKHPNPVIFSAADFCAIGVYLYLINFMLPGEWFWKFAMPVLGMAMIICVGTVTLCRYVKNGFLFIVGGASILSGCAVVVLEYLLNGTFGISESLIWSYYPAGTCTAMGVVLILAGICRPLRKALHKWFFV